MAKKIDQFPEFKPLASVDQKKGIPFHLNLIALTISFFIVLIAYKNVPSYAWVKDDLIKENLKIIKKYPKLSLDEKLGSKIGYDYHVIKMLRDATPENAVILMPRSDTCHNVRLREGGQNLSGGGLDIKIWCQYYLYPRKVVYDGSNDPDLSKANYVAIIAGHGYEHLKAPVDEKIAYTVYELK